MSGRLAAMLVRWCACAAVAAAVAVAFRAYLRPESVMSLVLTMSWCG